MEAGGLTLLLDFARCVQVCAAEPSFVEGFNRLTGSHLHDDQRTILEKAIDTACGRKREEDPADIARFVAFVWDVVWTRISNKEICPCQSEMVLAGKTTGLNRTKDVGDATATF